MSEPARPLPTPSDGEGPGLIDKLKKWLTPDDEAESVRDVIEELIEERIEESPEDAPAAIDPNERLLLANVLRLRGVTGADIMVPRADIVAVEAESPLGDVLRLMSRESHSRLPVYRETLDDVIGMVHIKDLAALAADNRVSYHGAEAAVGAPKLADIVRPVLFVPGSVRVLDLMLEMRLKRTHMGMVVDEYGGIDGIITIEDVIEQIVGEIDDEHDVEHALEVREDPDGTVVADARVRIEDFESRFGTAFSEEEHEATDTLGGLVYYLSGRVPGRSELVKHSSGMEFEVLEGDPRRVRRLRIRNIPRPQDS
jgi:magnesium and cobalt transporter